MPLTFPRKFVRGEKLQSADLYGELHIWPTGHYDFKVSIRNTDASQGCKMHAGIVLLDKSEEVAGSYGVGQEEPFELGPWGQRHEQIYGKIPAQVLARTETVAIAFCAVGESFDAAKFRSIASAGVELMLCPIPD